MNGAGGGLEVAREAAAWPTEVAARLDPAATTDSVGTGLVPART